MTPQPHDRNSTPDSERTEVFGQVPAEPAFHEQFDVNGDSWGTGAHEAGAGSAGGRAGSAGVPDDSAAGADAGVGAGSAGSSDADSDAELLAVGAGDDHRDEALNSNDKSMFVLIGLVALAVVASVVMLFTNSTTWMKIAVLAALWAAFLGALLVSRFRQQVGDERKRSAELQRIHQLEMDKEMATHREQELLLEQSYLDSLREQHADTLAELKVELQKLREHLAEMLGTDLEEERVALRAEAERIRELEAKADLAQTSRPALRRAEAVGRGEVGAHTQSGPVTPEGLRQVREEKREEHRAEQDAAAAAGAALAGAAMAAEPGHPANGTAIPVETERPSDARTAHLGGHSDARSGAHSGAQASTHTGGHSGGKFSTGSFAAVDWTMPEPEQPDFADEDDGYEDYADADAAGDHAEAADDYATATIPVHRDWAVAAGMKLPEEPAAPAQDVAAEEVSAEEAPAPESQQTPEAPEVADEPSAHHGRRRADENKNALTVAELLAQMRKEK